MRVKDSKAEGGKEEGEPSTTSIASTFIYLKRPPTEGKEVGAIKNLKMVYFASSTLDLASLKKIDLAGFGGSLVFAVNRGCLELFILFEFRKISQEFKKLISLSNEIVEERFPRVRTE